MAKLAKIGDPEDPRMVRIYAVNYPDRRLEGRAEALFRASSAANTFASRHNGAEIEIRRVTLREFSHLRRNHRL